MRKVSTICLIMFATPVMGQSFENTLSRAYQFNPELNQSRAQIRVANEGVPAALSGYRPTVTVTASQGYASTVNYATRSVDPTNPKSITLTMSQPLFDGHRTAATVKQSEHNIDVARAEMNVREQNVLLSATAAHANVLRDSAIVAAQMQLVQSLENQLNNVRTRAAVGETTQTDVIQSQSRLLGARSQLTAFQAALMVSRSVYAQVVLQPAKNLGAMNVANVPNNLSTAVSLGLARHPSIRAANYGADVALAGVRIAESALYPQLSLVGSVSRSVEQSAASPTETQTSQVLLSLTVPIFANGGRDYANIRQAKETVGVRKIAVDITRASVRQAVEQAWYNYQAAVQQLAAVDMQIAATEKTLESIADEVKVGTRNNLDLLNAQQELTSAKIARANAARERVVQSYSIASATGAMNYNSLRLKTVRFDDEAHGKKVRNLWFGADTR